MFDIAVSFHPVSPSESNWNLQNSSGVFTFAVKKFIALLNFSEDPAASSTSSSCSGMIWYLVVTWYLVVVGLVFGIWCL